MTQSRTSAATTVKTEEQWYSEFIREEIKHKIRWIVAGIIGFSIFCMSLGILGIISIIKVLFF